MKLQPVGSHIIGRSMIHKKPNSVIVPPDIANGSSRCFLIDAVGPGAAAAGYSPGQIVVAQKVWNVLLYGGSYQRAAFEHTDIMYIVTEAPLDEFTDLKGAPILEVIAAESRPPGESADRVSRTLEAGPS